MAIWTKFKNWFESRAEREQWILAVLFISVMVWIGYIAMVEPALEKRAQLKTELQSLTTTAESLESQVPQLTMRANTDPNRDMEIRAEELQRQNRRLAQNIEGQANFVQPNDLLSWIQSVLVSTENLELTNFDAKPAQPFFTTAGENGAEAGHNAMQVSKHPVEVVLEGDFFGIHDYLLALEQLPVDFYWQGFDYQVLQYPTARVTLSFYTLSYERTGFVETEGGENAD